MPQSTSIDLSNYVLVARYDLPEPTRTAPPANSLLAQEVSAVTYNWDTDTLFVAGDGSTSIVQISKTGQLISSMTLAQGASPQGTEFYDVEGLTYIGNGQFVMTEERDRQVVKFTYAANTVLTRANTQTVDLGTFVNNIGLEGLSYDPQTGGFIVVNEITPEEIFQTNIDFTAGTATNGSAEAATHANLFNPALVGVSDLADVFALSNITSLNGLTDSSHLLLLSQEAGKVVEVDRAGTIFSSLTITSNPGNPLSVPAQQHEGLTMDADGNLYVVSENGGGDFDHPQLWVYAPSPVPNQAPSAIALANQITAIDENSSTSLRVKVADVVLTDDGIGTNNYSVTGADAAIFEVDSNGLYIKAGTVLDYETKTSYAVTVNVDDATVGATPDASTSFNLTINNIVNENPGQPVLYVSEVAAWSSGNSPVASDWFEITNSSASAIDITGWKFDDNSNSFASSAPLNGITSIGAGESVIFLECAVPGDLAAKAALFLSTWFGATPPASLRIGSYTGTGVGLSTAGDAVNLYNASGILQANVSFGVSPSGTFATFNNAAGLNNSVISTLSVVGTNGAAKAVNDVNEVGSPGSVGRLIVSEVAPWSSGNSPLALRADWFEVTNTTAFAIDITGWKIDDNSGSPAAAVPLNGVTSLAAGQSVIFIETATPGDLPAKAAAFIQTWFGGTPPANLVIGSYSGAGVGLGAGGDAVNLYNATNILQASVSFGTSPTGPYATFDNAQGLNGVAVSQLAVSGVNGSFVAAGDATEIGSPGYIAPAVINGTAGNDTLIGTPGNDSLNGSTGNDTLIGGLGADIHNGGADNDTASYAGRASGISASLVTGLGPDGDSFISIENLTGSSGGDVLIGNSFANTLDGGAGNDVLIGNGGGDTLNGGADTDTVDYAGFAAAVNANLLTGLGTLGELLISIENITGSAFGDVLTGNAGSNTLSGGAGNDFLMAGSGADLLIGGADMDTVSYETTTTGIAANLTTGAGANGGVLQEIENLTGSAFGDVLTGDNGANSIRGGAGNDLIIAGNGSDLLIGGADNDTASYETATTGIAANLLTGAGANGGVLQEMENLMGSNFGDVLIGDDLGNMLNGGAGNDYIVGNQGSDVLVGGADNDIFRFETTSFGSDVITDYQDNADRLSFSAAVATDFGQFTILDNNTANVTLQIAGQSIVVQGAAAITLDAADFLFV